MKLSDEQMSDLYDKQALHENLMQYCRGLDRMDRELIKSTYWPDSTDDHGSFIGPGQEWAEAAFTWKDNQYNVNHHVSNVLIDLHGDRAQRESMFLCVVTFIDPAATMFLGGRYRDLCERRDGQWKILTRVCVWDYCEEISTRPGWRLSGVPRFSNWGRYFPEDPIFKDWSTSAATEYTRPQWEPA